MLSKQEAEMGSLQRRHKFDPFELEIVERVYDLACRHIEARDLYRETVNSAEEVDGLRKLVFACAARGRLDFDTLCDKVLAQLGKSAPDRRAA
jgi:hypothetical protein